MKAFLKSSHINLVAPTHDIDQDYNGVIAVDQIWEDVTQICLEDI